ncbi:hypothetical protein BRADI_1g04348v3 [Brachypodium distachyon]|uniref:Uncharacterized protein n=1 Tax=Brachypodium distachyon TaxID=15368 RepID=A0A0Q3J3J6_BRADI|nr:hypothetical protein BRADI_1g04348v3 [Brachypodium distachyon]
MAQPLRRNSFSILLPRGPVPLKKTTGPFSTSTPLLPSLSRCCPQAPPPPCRRVPRRWRSPPTARPSTNPTSPSASPRPPPPSACPPRRRHRTTSPSSRSPCTCPLPPRNKPSSRTATRTRTSPLPTPPCRADPFPFLRRVFRTLLAANNLDLPATFHDLLHPMHGADATVRFRTPEDREAAVRRQPFELDGATVELAREGETPDSAQSPTDYVVHVALHGYPAEQRTPEEITANCRRLLRVPLRDRPVPLRGARPRHRPRRAPAPAPSGDPPPAPDRVR